jgi:ankyrin repeat protein
MSRKSVSYSSLQVALNPKPQTLMTPFLFVSAGDTALHAAAANNLWNTSEALLRMGADAGKLNYQGKSPADRCQNPKP